MDQSNMQVNECIGEDLIGSDGERIGKIQEIYMDEQTNQPEWFAVKTGLFGNSLSFVPLSEANWTEEGITVRFSKSQVKDAPRAEADGRLSEDEEASLYDHYGMQYGEQRSDSMLPEGRADSSTDDAMTRSEEELVTGTRRQETGKARLKKWVETENVNVTVPIQRERARLVTEPITGENRDEAMRGPDFRENEYEETLYEEEPVVEKKAVPKERVRLEKDTVAEQREVAADVRKERIETEGDIDADERQR